ncbi:hypothetical protein POM88_042633 [Heracleum sosnowskyi]|uniref:Uncharacterized protein n=1 Tax=Heracleum sosnowskyi TaxID=360622 RepID=A0AAD8HGM4_9APIA|nr:hypothetical protein POM88_042633 [Heracleum sosnowskyi]
MDAGNVGDGDANQRQRFYVELKPGQTNIVSLKKLLREAGEAVSDDSSDEYEAEKYIRVELPRNKKTGALTIQDKVQHKTGRIKYSKSTDDQTIKKRKELVDFVGEEDDIQVDTKPKKKGKQPIKTAAESAVFINGISKAQEFDLQNKRCKRDFQSPRSSSGGVILKKHASSKLIPGNNISFTSSAHQILKGKQFIKTAAETATSVNGNSKAQECNIRNDLCKRDYQTRLRSSGGVILKKLSGASSKLKTGNNISFTSVAHQKFKEKKSTQHELRSRNAMSKNIEQEGFANIKRKSNKGRNELPDLNLPYSGHAPRTASVHMTNGPKLENKMLDWSVLQLEKLVENSNTPLIDDVQGADSSLLDIEKQMSPELKEKLAKVARLTQLNEGKISEELIDRLMGILGKYLQRKTLKKILRGMVLEDLYASKAECNYFKQIKMEFVRMIRLQAPSLHVKVFPAEVTKGTYSMGDQLEDKLYDLYDIFTQGLDEDIGPSLVRKLYAELAELWPKGTMDNHEIRKAICRAKERKMVLSSEEEEGHQTTKTRNLSARMDETIRGKSSSLMHRTPAYRNVTTDTTGLTRTSANRRLVSSMLTVDLPLTAPSAMSIPQKKLYRCLV